MDLVKLFVKKEEYLSKIIEVLKGKLRTNHKAKKHCLIWFSELLKNESEKILTEDKDILNIII
jgi:hypothetical protein